MTLMPVDQVRNSVLEQLATAIAAVSKTPPLLKDQLLTEIQVLTETFASLSRSR